ncbi:MAG: CinA family protein [Oscillospiraceae bacterium]|nr:CinA family protein [Oscillospiraceae bacterium]
MTEQEIRGDYRKITEKLIEKGKTITTMESCTSGLIASLITDTEGASAVLKGSFVTYSNIGKIMQGVPEETIEKYSVYSDETAIAMAEACKKTYNADYGIGVTGTMGNVDPANAAASVPGRVYFAIAKENETEVFYRELSPKPSRYEYKLAVAAEIAKELLERI